LPLKNSSILMLNGSGFAKGSGKTISDEGIDKKLPNFIRKVLSRNKLSHQQEQVFPKIELSEQT